MRSSSASFSVRSSCKHLPQTLGPGLAIGVWKRSPVPSTSSSFSDQSGCNIGNSWKISSDSGFSSDVSFHFLALLYFVLWKLKTINLRAKTILLCKWTSMMMKTWSRQWDPLRDCLRQLSRLQTFQELVRTEVRKDNQKKISEPILPISCHKKMFWDSAMTLHPRLNQKP